MVTTHRLTLADLEAMGEEGERIELIDGAVQAEKLVGMLHGAIAAELLIFIGAFARQHRLGRVFSSDTQYVMSRTGPIVFRPDAAFIRCERLPDGELEDSICPFAPDLAIEVKSPSNTESQLLRKVSIYLDSGTRQVWLVRPNERTVSLFSPDQPQHFLTVADTLDGGEVLPGFTLPLRDLFGTK